MFTVPKIENIKVNSDTTVLVSFETGIMKILDVAPFFKGATKSTYLDIKVNSEGLILNGELIISNCDLWSMGKFCGWDKK